MNEPTLHSKTRPGSQQGATSEAGPDGPYEPDLDALGPGIDVGGDATHATNPDFYRVLLSRANDAVFVLDTDGTIRFASPPAERVLGRTPGFLTGRRFDMLVADEDRRSFAELRTGRTLPTGAECIRMLHADGSTRVVSVAVTDARDQPELGGTILEVRDVTVSVDDYERLRTREARYRNLTDLADLLADAHTTADALDAIARQLARVIGDASAIMLIDPAGRELLPAAWHHPDPEAELRFGAILRANPTPLDSPFGFAQVARSGNMLLIDGTDGNRLWRSVNPVFRPMMQLLKLHAMLLLPLRAHGTVIGVLGLAREASGRSYDTEQVELAEILAERAAFAIERTQVEERLAESEARLRDAFEHAAIGMAIEGFDGRFERVNAAYARIVGRTRDSLEGAPFTSLTHPDDAHIDADTLHALQFGPATTRVVEKRIVRPDGRIAWVRAHVSARFDNAGNRVGLSAQIEDITSTVEATRRLDHVKSHDPTTGLPNRLNVLRHLVELRGYGDTVGVIQIGLDRFRRVNDSLGHVAGDAILGAIADRLVGATPVDAVIARTGGDEFVIVHPAFHTDDDTAAFARQLLTLVALPVELGDRSHVTTASIGVTTAGPDDIPEEVLRSAAIAMHRAKEGGRNRVECYRATLRTTATERLGAEDLVRDALRLGWFRLHYQPIVDLQHGRLAGAEALIRIEHPERGVLPPGMFLDAAEETGLITEIGAWALREACGELARWNAELGEGLTMAVNVSGRQLEHRDLGMLVTSAIDETRIAPDQLVLEMTESILVESDAVAFADLRALRAIGVHLALDDFGTGYSSLSYLKRFPVDKIKIDRSFVGGLDLSADDTAIVQAIIGLGETMNLAVVAEGIETAPQAARLRELRCEYGQGYHFDKPLPAAEFRAHARAGYTVPEPAPQPTAGAGDDAR